MFQVSFKKFVVIILLASVISLLQYQSNYYATMSDYDKLQSIQDFYGIPEEDRINIIYHIPAHKGYVAYYVDNKIYFCNNNCSKLDQDALTFVLAHELWHHHQKLSLGEDYYDAYLEDKLGFETEADAHANSYCRWHIFHTYESDKSNL